jgi:hypothetical protein
VCSPSLSCPDNSTTGRAISTRYHFGPGYAVCVGWRVCTLAREAGHR